MDGPIEEEGRKKGRATGLVGEGREEEEEEEDMATSRGNRGRSVVHWDRFENSSARKNERMAAE